MDPAVPWRGQQETQKQINLPRHLLQGALLRLVDPETSAEKRRCIDNVYLVVTTVVVWLGCPNHRGDSARELNIKTVRSQGYLQKKQCVKQSSDAAAAIQWIPNCGELFRSSKAVFQSELHVCVWRGISPHAFACLSLSSSWLRQSPLALPCARWKQQLSNVRQSLD